MRPDDEDTEPVLLPLGDEPLATNTAPEAADWISRTWEFPAAETAFVFLFFAVAASQVAGCWPEMRIQRYQVEVAGRPGQRFLEQLESDAARLGGHRVGRKREKQPKAE